MGASEYPHLGVDFPHMTVNASPSPVTIYWRPGCPSCARLKRDLKRIGVSATEVNIWREPQAAAVVRSLAGGNETVPTVMIGKKAMVNPSFAAVLEEIRRAAPGFAVEGDGALHSGRAEIFRVAQWISVIALVIASLATEAGGHARVSWIIDGATVACYALFRLARRQMGVPSRTEPIEKKV